MDLFTAQFRDLGGGLNPTGIWSVAFLRLKAAVERDLPVEVLEHALYAWMESRGIREERLDALLELSPQEGAREFGNLVRIAVDKGELPKAVEPLVSAAFHKIVSTRIARAATELEQEYRERRGRIDTIQKAHGINPQVESLVGQLLA